MAAWLLGAGFSLWRAVFLADVSLAPDKNMQDAEAFLDRVLLDHTIVYRDDKNSWSFGYYINNARFRLKQAAKELKDSERMDKLDGELRILKDGLKGADMGAREAYENVHKVMHILTGLLAKRLV